MPTLNLGNILIELTNFHHTIVIAMKMENKFEYLCYCITNGRSITAHLVFTASLDRVKRGCTRVILNLAVFVSTVGHKPFQMICRQDEKMVEVAPESEVMKIGVPMGALLSIPRSLELDSHHRGVPWSALSVGQ